jgi:hypothetical protein
MLLLPLLPTVMAKFSFRASHIVLPCRLAAVADALLGLVNSDLLLLLLHKQHLLSHPSASTLLQQLPVGAVDIVNVHDVPLLAQPFCTPLSRGINTSLASLNGKGGAVVQRNLFLQYYKSMTFKHYFHRVQIQATMNTRYVVNDSPHPQDPLELGFMNTNSDLHLTHNELGS